jgi:hypothetical protein
MEIIIDLDLACGSAQQTVLITKFGLEEAVVSRFSPDLICKRRSIVAKPSRRQA